MWWVLALITTVAAADQWAVRIPGGQQAADRVAKRHNLQNMGQVGSLQDYYVFQHPTGRTRSRRSIAYTHAGLNRNPAIQWVEKQVPKKRMKRDFSEDETSPLLSRPRRRPVNEGFNIGTKRQLFNDPLWEKQWYMNKQAVTPDMNIEPAWAKGITGKGVVISILDDGIERDHPDLVVNYDPLASKDINDSDDDPMPRYDISNENRHGTRCAGEVSAQANNSVCTVGVAYNSRIGGVRMLDGQVTDAVEAHSLSLNPQHIDIYSASWGPDDNGKVVDGPGVMAKRAFVDGITLGRKGKGSIFVWASGNGGNAADSCNCDGYTNSIFTLSISSATEEGKKPWYLEECSSTIATTYSSGQNFHGDRRIVTTDLRKSCTESHTGTSASAPLAAGIVALVLEANPSLTWRDVQHLVVRTSRPAPLSDGQWVVNGVGRKVSSRYGYGLMDAGGLVDMALTWANVGPQHICSTPNDSSGYSLNGKGIEVKIASDSCSGTPDEILALEHVQAQITLDFSNRGDIQLYLTSPAGTKSMLLPARKFDNNPGKFTNWPFMSVAFWGEKGSGEWTLQIANVGSESNIGTLSSWRLVLYGTGPHDPLAEKLTENATAKSAGVNYPKQMHDPPLPIGDKDTSPRVDALNSVYREQLRTAIDKSGVPYWFVIVVIFGLPALLLMLCCWWRQRHAVKPSTDGYKKVPINETTDADA